MPAVAIVQIFCGAAQSSARVLPLTSGDATMHTRTKSLTSIPQPVISRPNSTACVSAHVTCSRCGTYVIFGSFLEVERGHTHTHRSKPSLAILYTCKLYKKNKLARLKTKLKTWQSAHRAYGSQLGIKKKCLLVWVFCAHRRQQLLPVYLRTYQKVYCCCLQQQFVSVFF